MNDTNYFGGIIRILEIPKHQIFKKNLSITKLRAQISQFRNVKIITLAFWGNLAHDIITNYNVNDYLIIEGYLSLYKKKNSKSKRVKITVRKIYPFFLL